MLRTETQLGGESEESCRGIQQLKPQSHNRAKSKMKVSILCESKHFVRQS